MKADVDRLVQKEHKLAKGVLYILDLKSNKITIFKRIVHELKFFRFLKIPSYKSNLL